MRNLGVGALGGAVSAVTIATNGRFVGSSTDAGHFGFGADFGVIQSSHELNRGKIEDFFTESVRMQYQWALRLANSYYQKPAARNYWDGCSTGGAHGLMLAAKHGDDFDGFLVGAPFTNHTRTSSGGAFRQWANKDLAASSVTDPKMTATIQRLIAACDGLDGVVDGLLNEPRACRESAHVNVCGQPNAAAPPNCLTPTEADVIDIVLDGPRNDLGKRVWFPSGRATLVSLTVPSNGRRKRGFRVGPQGSRLRLAERAADRLGRSRAAGDEHARRSHGHRDARMGVAKDSGAKILMWQGSADAQFPFQSNIYYYGKVLDLYGGADNVHPWFRYFLAPGVAHCGGGAGPQPQNLFTTLMAWAEGGSAPDSILASGGGRTHPLPVPADGTLRRRRQSESRRQLRVRR